MQGGLIHNTGLRIVRYVASTILLIAAAPDSAGSQELDATMDRPDAPETTMDRPDAPGATMDRPEAPEATMDRPEAPEATMDTLESLEPDSRILYSLTPFRVQVEDTQQLINAYEESIRNTSVDAEAVERISFEKDYLEKTLGLLDWWEDYGAYSATISGYFDPVAMERVESIQEDQQKRLRYLEQASEIMSQEHNLPPVVVAAASQIAKGVLPVEVSLLTLNPDYQLEHVLGYRIEYAPPFRLDNIAGLSQLSSPASGSLAVASYCFWARDPRSGEVVSERFFQRLPAQLPGEPIKVDLWYFGDGEKADVFLGGSRICRP